MPSDGCPRTCLGERQVSTWVNGTGAPSKVAGACAAGPHAPCCCEGWGRAGLSREAAAFFVVHLGGSLPARSGDNGRRGKIGSCATFERVRPWASCLSVSPFLATNACWD